MGVEWFMISRTSSLTVICLSFEALGRDLRVLLGHKSGTSTAQGQQRLMTRGCVWHMLSVAEQSGKALFSFLFSFLQFCLWRLWGYMLWARSDFDLCVLCMHFQSESVLRRLSVCLQVTFSAFFRCSKTYFYQLCRWWFDIQYSVQVCLWCSVRSGSFVNSRGSKQPSGIYRCPRRCTLVINCRGWCWCSRPCRHIAHCCQNRASQTH